MLGARFAWQMAAHAAICELPPLLLVPGEHVRVQHVYVKGCTVAVHHCLPLW